jgi:hypothetical protein
VTDLWTGFSVSNLVSTAKTLHVYRQLLRRAHLYGAVNGNAMWTQFVRTQFRKHAAERDAARSNALRLDAVESALMFESIHAYHNLLVKYNIGTAIDERERIRRTAARVGLAIPDWNDPPGTGDIVKKYQTATKPPQS